MLATLVDGSKPQGTLSEMFDPGTQVQLPCMQVRLGAQPERQDPQLFGSV